MDRAELVKKVRTSTYKITNAEVKIIVDKVFDVITEELLNRGNVSINGFGRFYIKKQPNKVIRHPKTREEIRIQPEAIRYKPSAVLVKRFKNKCKSE